MEQAIQRISNRGNSGILLKWIDRLSNPDAESSDPAVESSAPAVESSAPAAEPIAPTVEEPVTSISITITLNDAAKFPKTMTVEKEKAVYSVLEEYLKVRLRPTTHA